MLEPGSLTSCMGTPAVSTEPLGIASVSAQAATVAAAQQCVPPLRPRLRQGRDGVLSSATVLHVRTRPRGCPLLPHAPLPTPPRGGSSAAGGRGEPGGHPLPLATTLCGVAPHLSTNFRDQCTRRSEHSGDLFLPAAGQRLAAGRGGPRGSDSARVAMRSEWQAAARLGTMPLGWRQRGGHRGPRARRNAL